MYINKKPKVIHPRASEPLKNYNDAGAKQSTDNQDEDKLHRNTRTLERAMPPIMVAKNKQSIASSQQKERI